MACDPEEGKAARIVVSHHDLVIPEGKCVVIFCKFETAVIWDRKPDEMVSIDWRVTEFWNCVV